MSANSPNWPYSSGCRIPSGKFCRDHTLALGHRLSTHSSHWHCEEMWTVLVRMEYRIIKKERDWRLIVAMTLSCDKSNEIALSPIERTPFAWTLPAPRMIPILFSLYYFAALICSSSQSSHQFQDFLWCAVTQGRLAELCNWRGILAASCENRHKWHPALVPVLLSSSCRATSTFVS